MDPDRRMDPNFKRVLIMGKMDRLPPKDQLTMGIHALHTLLIHAPERILTVYADASDKGARKNTILELCKKKRIDVEFVSSEMLTKMTGSDSHQSFAAHVQGRKFFDGRQFLDSIEERERAIVLMLDQVFDPQNFGSILRTAECMGAAGVVWSKNRGTDLTPVVAKASSGASEWLPLIRISNLAETMAQFQEAGFEAVASSLETSSQSAFNHSFAPKTLLILGSEGEGIQPLILKRADKTLFIPMQGKIESLNVAQAASVFLTLYNK